MNEMTPVIGYSDGDIDTNLSSNESLNTLVEQRYSRRQIMGNGVSALAMATLGTSVLAACGDNNAAPTFTAGSTGNTTSGRTVTLNGTVSDDKDVISNATWTQIAGPTVALTLSGNNASFTAPAVSANTDLTFEYGGSDTKGATGKASTTVTVSPAALGFTSVPRNKNDIVTVPTGYNVTVMTRLGDPLAAGVSAYANNGTDTGFDKRIGDHGDALYWYGLNATGARDDNSSTRGLMVQNHENIQTQYLHVNGSTNTGGVRPEAEALKEIEAHGVSVTEYRDTGTRSWSYVQDSTFNRRITPNTTTSFSGPVRGTDFLKTPFSVDGTQGRGTINNCANGHSGWATNLTCEENWAGYFRRDNSGAGTDNALRSGRELRSLRRYGVTTAGNYSWSTVVPAVATNTIFRRWDARATAGGTATTDWRNEPNQFGWVVEVDPYDPASVPRKRTALGRFGHEGAWLGRLIAGKKVAVYMGDDARNDYLYKFVSNAVWDAADANRTDRLAVGDKYLDAGTLYVAKFNADGSGNWLPLVFGSVPPLPAGTEAAYTFESQADILVNTRLAADSVGATKMDRPEWTAVNPANGEVYLTLTNNRTNERPLTATDAANPRHYADPRTDTVVNPLGNPNGHIIRLKETGDDVAATGFTWDIYLFGANADASAANVNLSGLTAENDFSSPDGLWFGRPTNVSGQVKPLLWIQTDDGAYTDVINNQMLVGIPGTVGDGGAGTVKTITNTGTGGATATQATRVGASATSATLKRFLIGPVGCEITGVDSTPDGRTLFVGIQHPGEVDGATTPSPLPSNWPANQGGTAAPTARPRSAVVAITRTDGGIVGL